MGWHLQPTIEAFAADVETVIEECEDTAELAEALDATRQAMAALKAIDGQLTDALTTRVRVQQAQAGPWRIERRGGSNRSRWDSDAVFSALIRRSRINPETGEILAIEESWDALIEAVRACVPLTQSLGWRSRALREWGVDPDEFCDRTPAPFSFDVHLTDPEAVAR